METKTIFNGLKTLGIPTAHNVFVKPQKPPYIIYLDNGFQKICANSKCVLTKTKITVELYTKPETVNNYEETVESYLDGFTTYEKNRAFDEKQGLYITYYNFYIH